MESNISTFRVDIVDTNNRREILRKALADGRIACDKEHMQNIFTIKAENQHRIVESWQISYPELSQLIEGWKYACIDDGLDPTHKEFRVFPVQRGKEMLCIFLGLFKTNTPDVLKVVHLRAKITFSIRNCDLFGNASFIERAIMFILSDGASEVINMTYNYINANRDIRMLDTGNNTEILAGIVLSEYYSGVSINWLES
ncbi:hypothetical protein RirG_181280 [Rhizophagus irregularis DAOM 197198w]|nr:hypothetical protein RirG_181280 [Rhizophagus irregularis DAOM 197198w]